ncbi:DNA-binding response regulator [Propionigenium maris DSM 9537]|uniref:DNA-binding response regulator n=1 Tax=Propionigenium maris DSM 9537 TaxID=1123000 RepID=A0A9W6LNC0_9FUSO|nr:response regulator transcription factor [Propionigenium maris]GLI57181.1 DNA-binding response regulator [Propionigenium maris DSM 9537]
MKKILLVEDEFRIRKITKDFLVEEGYKVVEAADGREAIDKFNGEAFDLVLLDVMLPEIDGWSVLREIRKDSNVLVMMLTARSDDSDQIFGYQLKADDYLTKPFNPDLLIARVKALLRRGPSESKDELSFGNIVINEKQFKVFIDGEDIELTKKEFEMFKYLTENKGNVLTREQILNRVWGYDYYGDFRVVDNHVKRLRKKLKADYIETVRGVGYRFEVK